MRRTIWVLSIVGIASMMWLLQTPLRTYGQTKSDMEQAPAMSAPSSNSNSTNSPSTGDDCECTQGFSNSFAPMTFGALGLGPLVFGQATDRKKIDQEVRDSLQKAQKEIETAMKSEDWAHLREMPDMNKLQAELQETLPQALQEVERKVIAISPMDDDEDAGWLGVEVSEVTPEQAQQFKLGEARGVVVIGVDPDSPAGKAGIKEKDVIVGYGGGEGGGGGGVRRGGCGKPPGGGGRGW